MSHTDHRLEGFRAGLAAWRPRGKHAVPVDHPPGSTPEGTAWFLGCVAGLIHAESVADDSDPEPESNP